MIFRKFFKALVAGKQSLSKNEFWISIHGGFQEESYYSKLICALNILAEEAEGKTEPFSLLKDIAIDILTIDSVYIDDVMYKELLLELAIKLSDLSRKCSVDYQDDKKLIEKLVKKSLSVKAELSPRVEQRLLFNMEYRGGSLNIISHLYYDILKELKESAKKFTHHRKKFFVQTWMKQIGLRHEYLWEDDHLLNLIVETDRFFNEVVRHYAFSHIDDVKQTAIYKYLIAKQNIADFGHEILRISIDIESSENAWFGKKIHKQILGERGERIKTVPPYLADLFNALHKLREILLKHQLPWHIADEAFFDDNCRRESDKCLSKAIEDCQQLAESADKSSKKCIKPMFFSSYRKAISIYQRVNEVLNKAKLLQTYEMRDRARHPVRFSAQNVR